MKAKQYQKLIKRKKVLDDYAERCGCNVILGDTFLIRHSGGIVSLDSLEEAHAFLIGYLCATKGM